jgi:hypothetical protein
VIGHAAGQNLPVVRESLLCHQNRRDVVCIPVRRSDSAADLLVRSGRGLAPDLSSTQETVDSATTTALRQGNRVAATPMTAW